MSTALAGVLSLAGTPQAYANPTGGQVVGGQASISSVGNTLTVQQTTSRAIINWSSFDIGPGEITQFEQPSSSSIALNRVTGSQNPSQILGTLNANGQVWIINPNGVMFGGNAQVNVAGLVATSVDIDNNNFMAGNYTFNHPGNPNAVISNAGSITTADAGLVAFVAPNVSNAGLIQAKLGKVQLGSGDGFTLDLYGDGLINLQASPAVTQQIVSNSGMIRANGGTVTLTAAAAQNTVNSLINMSGVIQAESIGSQNGQIVLYAEGSNAVQGNVAANKGQKQGTSTVLVSGWLDASGYGSGQTGGNISVLGDNVGIMSGALLDASGDAGGGYIKIGGDFHGQGTTPTALNTVVQNGALIEADAITSGNGGNVAVWSDNYTNFAGLISARGGSQSGNGGYVETSGHDLLSLSDANDNNGMVYASAPNGTAGTWLLDPADVTINGSADNGVSSGPTYTPTGGVAESNILASEIVAALNLGTNVTVTTGGDSASGTGGGSITVSSAISATTGTSGSTGSLTLSSYENITISGAITLGSGTVTGGNLILDADNHANGSGYISVGAAIATNGGNITMGGGEATPSNIVAGTGFATGNGSGNSGVGININAAIVNAGGGNIIMNGDGYTGGTNTASAYGVNVQGGGIVETSGTGTVTVNATGGGSGSGNLNYGVLVAGTGSTIETTGSGLLSITATGGNTGGSGSNNEGINVNVIHGIQATGNGGITLNGTGGNGGGSGANNYGITVGGGGSITGNGGAMSITGTGGNSSGNSNNGIYAFGGTISNTGAGTLTLQGTGSGNTNSANDYGVAAIYNGAIAGIISTVNGALTIINTVGGGAGSGTGNYGVIVSGTGSTIETTGSSAVSITAKGGANNSAGLSVSIANGIQTTGTGSITANADTYFLNSANDIDSVAGLTLAPYTSTNSVSVYGSTGTVAYTSTLLADVTAASYSFGNTSDTNTLTAAGHTWTTPVSFITGTGAITLSGIQAMGTNNLTLESDTLPTISATPTGTGTLSIITLARKIVTN